MKKWAIIQPSVGAPLEIWRYIDMEKEARTYWYISQAIDKYGLNNVIPLTMNAYGGYSSIDKSSNTIVRIIESDTKPVLSLSEMYPVNAEQLQDAWMSPDGTTYSCNSYGHCELAERIVKEFNIGKVEHNKSFFNAPDDKLLFLGWIKIVGGKWLGYYNRITDRQISILEAKNIQCRTGSVNKQ